MSIDQQTHLPPQKLEAEESVLGAMMVSERALDPVILEVRLEEEDFYRERHRLVFRMIKKLMDDREAVDALTVGEALAANGLLEEAGGKGVVTELATSVTAAGTALHYAKIVKANAQLRRLLTASQKIQQSVLEREGEPRDLFEHAEAALFKVARDDTSSEFHLLADILDAETKKLEKLAKGELQLTGTPSGFRDLDDTLGGFQPGNLIILAARPSMGKSALVCNIAENVSLKSGKPVAFFSLEMSEAEIAHRFIANRARFSGDKLRKGQVTERDWPKVLRACNELEQAPLWIDDSSDLSMLELRAKCRRLAASEGDLGLVIVDYIQLMRAEDPRSGRVEQVGQFSRGLKILARELEVPVIGLSQLSRAPEQRTENGRKGVPMLSDLRESGCLTGDSRVLLPDEGRYVALRDLVGKSGFRVLAVDTETWKLEPRPVTKAFSTGTKPVFKIRTALGKEIRATANHKFLAIDGWHRLDSVEAGTRIALPRRTPTPEAPTAETMTDAHLALLGHLIGDGCTLPRHTIQYTSNERRLADLVGSLAVECFGDRVRPRVVEEHDKKRNRQWFQTYLSASGRLARGRRNPVAAWLDELGAFGLRSYEKRVPSEVFGQADRSIALFLRHLWATDGCVWLGGKKPQPRAYYGTASAGLARDVQSLLLRLGITARISTAKGSPGRPGYQVTISGAPDLKVFLNSIGALGDRKERHAHDITEWLVDRKPNTNRDIVPHEAWGLMVKPARVSAGVTERAFQAELGSSYCGSTLYRAAMSRERAGRVAEILHIDKLAKLADSDIYWDSIVSIEPDGEDETFDLTVDDLHSFVAEDIVVHNSIEQDADVVMFIYRESRYNEEADDSEAELLIDKHRNGPIGNVDMVFMAQYPRFIDKARSGMGDRPIVQRAGEEPPPLAEVGDEY
ncbi:replicative DNA helicase [soil metagenome]